MPLYSLKLKLGHPNLKFTHVLNLAYSRAIFLRRQWQLTPVLLPGKSHGQRSLVGCSPWGHEESDTTEWLPFHTLEKEMATHSSVLAWRIPGTRELGGLPSLGSVSWTRLKQLSGSSRGHYEVSVVYSRFLESPESLLPQPHLLLCLWPFCLL